MDSESIFVSYSSKDRPFAEGFAKELQNLGINAWIDQLGIELGENWDNAIEDALEKSDTFLLMISPTAVESSNVQDEANIAFKEGKKIVPILLKQCDLPMRWQRKQYVDLTQDPEKGLMEIIEFLKLKEEESFQKLKDLLSLIGVSSEPEKQAVMKAESDSDQKEEQEIKLEDLLTSEEEISFAADLKLKGIKANKKLIIFVTALSIVLLAILISIGISIPTWIIIAGCLSINLLSIAPFGGIKKRKRIVSLMDLLKLKRNRLTRIMNKITKKEIDEFNNEFKMYVSL